MKKIVLITAFMAAAFTGYAQDPSAALQVDADPTTPQGFLMPRMADHTAITTPAAGLQVYNTTTNKTMLFDGTNWVETSGATAAKFVDGTTATDAVYTAGAVGIGTDAPDASAALQVDATDKGLLIPRMTTAQRTAIGSPATGLEVYDTDTNSFWYYDGSEWRANYQWTTADNYSIGGVDNKILTYNNSTVDSLRYATRNDGLISTFSLVHTGGTAGATINTINRNNTSTLAWATLGGLTDDVETTLSAHNSSRNLTRWNDLGQLEGGVLGGYSEILSKGSQLAPWTGVGTETSKGMIVGVLGEKPLHFGTDNALRMTIDKNGSVAIGDTTTPTEKLEVEGSVYSTSTAPFKIYLPGAAVKDSFVFIDPSDNVYIGRNNADMSFRTSGAIRAIIKSNGNVGIGTTTAPAAKLDVNGAIKVGNNAATATPGMIRYNSATDKFQGYTSGSGWVDLH